MDNLRKMYIDENKTAREISVILGKSLSYVVNKLSSNNIRKGITTEWFNISLTNLSNEEIYTLGFIWADGYLNHSKDKVCRNIGIQMVDSDFDVIKHIFFKCGNWSLFHKNEKVAKDNVKRQASTTITICSSEFGKILTSYDYKDKSILSPAKILDIIPDDKKYLFFRGYSDGDGCFYTKGTTCQYSIGSTYEQDWSCVEGLFKSLNINTYSINRKISLKGHKSSVIRITNMNDISIFGDYIYQDNINLSLTRKFETFSIIKDKSINRKRKIVPTSKITNAIYIS